MDDRFLITSHPYAKIIRQDTVNVKPVPLCSRYDIGFRDLDLSRLQQVKTNDECASRLGGV